MKDRFSNKMICRPILIVGPERSGTTLLYSLLANADEFYWFSRIDSLLHRYPLLAAISRRILDLFDRETYIARVGQISRMKGFNTPSECISYWGNHFGVAEEDNYLVEDDRFTSQDVTEKKRRALLKDLRKRLRYSGRERILLKQPGFSLKLDYWDRIFEDARYLICIRDLSSNITSLVKAKQLSEKKFWGTKIPGWREYLEASHYRQALIQLKSIYQIMRESLRAQDLAERTMIVSYDALVADPETVLRKVAEFCEINWNRKLEASLAGVDKSKGGSIPDLENSNQVSILSKYMAEAEELLADLESER